MDPADDEKVLIVGRLRIKPNLTDSFVTYSFDVPKHINILYDKKCHGTDSPFGLVCPMTFFIIQDINVFGNVS